MLPCWGLFGQPKVEERSFLPQSLSNYRNNPDYQYHREHYQSTPKEDPKADFDLEDIDLAPTSRSAASTILRILFWVVVTSLVLFLIYQAMGVNWRGLFRKKERLQGTNLPVVGEWDDLETMDLQSRLKEALESGQYRHAIRILYLDTLLRLQEDGLIRTQRDKTNHAYLQELGESRAKHAFQELLWLYEKTWYGEFPVERLHYDWASARHQAIQQATNRRAT